MAKKNKKNNNEDNDGENEGVPFFIGSPKDFLKKMQAEGRKRDTMHGVQSKAAIDGYADVAEGMHIVSDEINRSNDLNIAAMLSASRTFDSVFKAMMGEVDAQEVHHDQHKKFIAECGIVAAGEDGCFHCAPGGVHLHDVQLLAGVVAMRYFLFSRLRKISTSLPLIREVAADGQEETALAMLTEAMASVSAMMVNIEKLGFVLREDHPVTIKAKAGAAEAGALRAEIAAAITKKAFDKNKED